MSPVMQITSLLLHWMPACVLWTLRWYPARSVKLDYDNRSDAAKARLCRQSPAGMQRSAVRADVAAAVV
jgi:hypothetical protein